MRRNSRSPPIKRLHKTESRILQAGALVHFGQIDYLFCCPRGAIWIQEKGQIVPEVAGSAAKRLPHKKSDSPSSQRRGYSRMPGYRTGARATVLTKSP